MKIEEIMEKNMQKIEATSPEAQSADIVAGNIEQLKALFPELITKGASGVSVNVDVLKALVGDKTVSDTDEKYGLNWHGKRRARQLALSPSNGTLRPCKDDSVDWDRVKALAVDIGDVLNNPDVSFSHYEAFQGATLEDALRSRGLTTIGNVTGTRTGYGNMRNITRCFTRFRRRDR